MSRTLLQTLTLPYDSIRTLYEGGCEVRLYRNEITGGLQVGKRVDILGLEESVAVREATLLQQIRHSNIVPVLDVAEVSDAPKPMRVIELIMPFYERGSLCDAFVRGERFSVGEAVESIAAALRGLGELHEVHKILHRDLKSPNLLLAEDGSRLHIGDLGVAVPMEADGTAEAFANVQLYTPPEVFTTGRVSRRSDIYQMGLALLEAASGPLPYGAYDRDPMATRLRRGRRAVLDRDLRLPPVVPKRIRAVINKAMAVDPAQRFGSAAEMAARLTRAPLVDWNLVTDLADHRVWEGASAARPDRQFRVEAKKRRRGVSWALSGLQCVTKWQRIVPDQIVADPDGAAARGFFDAIVDIAKRR